MIAPDHMRNGQPCCPWCFASEEYYENVTETKARCGYCECSIPLDAEWYQNGAIQSI